MSDTRKRAEELANSVGEYRRDGASEEDISAIESALRDAEARGMERAREMAREIANTLVLKDGTSRPERYGALEVIDALARSIREGK